MTGQVTLELDETDSRYVSELLASGAYASAEEVVHAALLTLSELETTRQASIERLRAKLRQTLESPAELVPLPEAMERLRAHVRAQAAKSSANS